MKTNKNANITQIRAHSLQTFHKVEAYDRCIYTSVLAEMAHGARLAQKPMARARGKRRPHEQVHGVPDRRRSCDRGGVSSRWRANLLKRAGQEPQHAVALHEI